MKRDITFYMTLFLRRLHYFLAVALLVAAAAVTVAYTLPPIYRAQARLLVEAPQIPGDLASSTVRASTVEMLQIIEQRLMARANLLDLSRRLGIHADRPELAADEIVADMRRRIDLDLPGLRDPAPVVVVAFDAPDGAVSAQVTNEIVTQILQENLAMRTAASRQTLAFFEQEVARLNAEMAEQGALVLAFKEQNKEALPDSLDYRRNRQSSLQERQVQLERELASLRDRRTRMEDLYRRTGLVESTNIQRTPEQTRLAELRSQLAAARVIYAPGNPRVVALETQVAALEAAVQAQSGDAAEGISLAQSNFEFELADIDGQMAFIADQKLLIEQELAALAASIDATPSNAITLSTLERDYDNIRLQYNQAVDRMAQASTGERIEAQSQGQRITVIEQAVVPEEPAKPNRKLIVAAGLGGGTLLGLALVALLEILNQSIRRPSELAARLGIEPFATIPYIETRRERRLRRGLIAAALLLVVVAIPGGLYLLHVHYLPMDMLIEKLADRLGLGGLFGQMRTGAAG